MTTATFSDTGQTQVFFDGQCPVCAREVRVYKRRDARQQLQFVDIAAPDFDARAYGLDPARVTQVMHSRTPDGVIHTQIDAFRTIWRALPPSVLTRAALAFLAIPGMVGLANIFYRLFARNRYRLTGRCTAESCETKFS